MVAITPDYIIADCGCPQWNKSRREIADFDTAKYFTINIEKQKRLLPQRETISDYYVQVLVNKLEGSSPKQHSNMYHFNKKYEDPSFVKIMKTHRNEATKQSISIQPQQQPSHSRARSNPQFSDKRQRSRTTTTPNTMLDSDLDVF